MTNSSSEEQFSSPFGKTISLLALLAAALYFTGWVYRWAYYDFFQVEVTVLDLPFESFYLAAFQVLFGHPVVLLRTFFLAIITGSAVIATLLLRKNIGNRIQAYGQVYYRPFSTKTVRTAIGFFDEVIALLLILTALFWTARWQAYQDSWRDAVNATSSLPVITVVMKAESAALGFDRQDPFAEQSLSERPRFRVIGDAMLYENLLGTALSNTEDTEQPRVWRLLSDRDGFFYIFPALPKKDRNLRFPVVTIYESSEQINILSPSVAK